MSLEFGVRGCLVVPPLLPAHLGEAAEELHVTLVHGDLQALGGGRRRGALPDSEPSFRPRRGEEEESRETADAHDCSADVRNASRRSASKACVTEERACGCGAREGGCVSERTDSGTGVLSHGELLRAGVEDLGAARSTRTPPASASRGGLEGGPSAQRALDLSPSSHPALTLSP